jgi:hypothetical protein
MRSSLLINGSKLSGRMPNSKPLRSIAPISRRNCCGASAPSHAMSKPARFSFRGQRDGE